MNPVRIAAVAAAVLALVAFGGCGSKPAAGPEPVPAPSSSSAEPVVTTSVSPTVVPVDTSSDDYAYGWFEANSDRDRDPAGSADYQSGFTAGAAAFAAWENGGRQKVRGRADGPVVKDWYKAARKTGWIDGTASRAEIAENVCEAWNLGQPGGKDKKLAEITAQQYVDDARRIDLAAADLVDMLVGQGVCKL